VNTSVLLILVALLGVACGFRRTRDSDRLLVYRLGRAHRIAGPGIIWPTPLIDRALRVNLDRAVPDWRSLRKEELVSRLFEYCRQPAPPGS
jgi:regulator of protease activity HflC (stomatin/prohibitin superfamily)